jgi:hypothetical protein
MNSCCAVHLEINHPFYVFEGYLLISYLKHNTTITVHQLPHWRGRKSLFVQQFLNANKAFIGLSDAENTSTSFQKRHLRSFYVLLYLPLICTEED